MVRFQTSTPWANIAPHALRQLRLLGPGGVSKYQDKLYEQLTYHRIFDRLENLKQAIEMEDWTVAHTEEYETIDKITAEPMLYAERQVGHWYTGHFEWSPGLKQAVQAYQFWHLKLRRKRNKPISMGKLEQYTREGNIQEAHHRVTSDEEAIKHLHLAATDLKDCQHKYKELSESHLESLAEAIGLE